MLVYDPTSSTELFDALIRYFTPFILIVLSAPVDAFMPWFSTAQHQSEEVYTTWTAKIKALHSKTKSQEHSALIALLYGIVLLAAVVVVDVFLQLPRLTTNYICVGMGIVTTIAWFLHGRKARRNSDRYK